jgi:hypothetical protein
MMSLETFTRIVGATDYRATQRNRAKSAQYAARPLALTRRKPRAPSPVSAMPSPVPMTLISGKSRPRSIPVDGPRVAMNDAMLGDVYAKGGCFE